MQHQIRNNNPIQNNNWVFNKVLKHDVNPAIFNNGVVHIGVAVDPLKDLVDFAVVHF